jgi:hypothetical protein
VVDLAGKRWKKKCHIACNIVPLKVAWRGVTAYLCCGNVKKLLAASLDDPPCGPGASEKKLLGRFIHFWVADRTQAWHPELGTHKAETHQQKVMSAQNVSWLPQPFTTCTIFKYREKKKKNSLVT